MSSMLFDGHLSLTDPIHPAGKSLSRWERLAASLIVDSRDLPFLKLTLFYLLSVVPAAAYIFLAPHFPWIFSGLYLVALFSLLTGPYILMLHNISHRKLFKKGYEKLNYVIVWFLGPFFGESPETYYVHHVGMHHVEENLSGDLSSTMRYQRDSLLDFMRYFLRFFFLAPVELAFYLKKKKRRKLLQRLLLGELSWYALMGFLCLWNWQATLVVFIIPLVVVRFLMMSGNWTQHAFISREAPDNSFQNSITCINSRYNRNCFNDGYHIGHHLNATLHWTQMPEDFLRHKQSYIEQKAIVFEKIDYFGLWICLMLKRYDWIAKHYVHLDPNHKLEKPQVIELLRSRTRPFASL